MPSLNYKLGITPHARETPAALLHAVAVATLQGDPGDWGDINRVMETVSSHMNETPSAHAFKRGDMERMIVAFHVPKDEILLLVDPRDFKTPRLREAVALLGFNPATLQPIEA